MAAPFPAFLRKALAASIPFVVLASAAVAQDAVVAAADPVEPDFLAQLVPTETTAEPAANDAEPELPAAAPEGPAVETQTANDPEPVSATVRRFHYAFRVTVRGVYDDNINLRQTNKESDFTTAIEPTLMLGFGDIEGRQENYLRFDYAPSGFIYAEHDENNTVQHLLGLTGQYRFRRLTLNLNQTIQLLDGTNLDNVTDEGPVRDRANLDVSGRAEVDIYTTRLNASYFLTGKTFLSSGLGAVITDYAALLDSEVYSGDLFLNYVYSPKLVFGFGGAAGFAEVDEPSPDQTFQQARARVTYDYSGKLSFNASGGLEFRQFKDSGRDQYTSPVFEIDANYKPFDGTAVRLSATRRTVSSAVLAGEDYATTGLVLTVRQRFLRRFSLGLTAGYENSDYFSTTDAPESGRTDNYYFAQPSIDMSVTRFWTVGAYYLRRENDSSLGTFRFSANQLGLRTSLSF